MRKHLALGAVLAIGLGTSAFAAEAEGFSYNLIEGGYVTTEIDDFDIDGEGFTVGGSFELGSNLFGFASINDIDYDGPVSSNQITVGLGFNWALSPDLDLVSGISYERIEAKVSGVSADDDGFGLNVGLRGRVAERLELTGNVKYADFGNGSDDFTLSAGGRYYFTDAFAAGPDLSHNDDGTTWGISFRYDFGSTR
jgi:hypothetical protein